jgi:hypothetical protein
MRRVQTKQTLKLRLLAFVLALALMWYSLNPSPRSSIRRKREDKPSDEKQPNIEHKSVPAILPFAFRPAREMANVLPSPDEDEDDFEWPEYIDG